MELKEKDDTISSESSDSHEDWGIMISRFMKSYPAMSLKDTMSLSYPQFKALYTNIYNEKTFNIVVPFLGKADESTDEKNNAIKNDIQKNGKEANILEINSIVAQMNREFIK